MTKRTVDLRQWLPWAMIVAIWAVPQIGTVVVGLSPALQGGLMDPDSFMRLVRVGRLYETGAWYDITIPRSNAPYGDILHWTRPFDVILLLGGWLLSPVLGFAAGLHWAGVTVAPILLLAAAFVLGWAVRPILDDDKAQLAMVVMLTQPGVLIYSLAGRADHHGLLFLLFALSIGLMLRLLMGRPGPRPDRWLQMAAGAALGLGVWVSIEFLLAVAVAQAALGLVWLRHGEGWAKVGLGSAVGFAAMLVAAILLERPFTDFLAAEYDRISVVHLALAFIMVGFWAAAAALTQFFGGLAIWIRAGAAAVLGLAGLGLLYGLFPMFYAGPMAAVDPRLFDVWMDRVGEMGALVPTDLGRTGRLILLVGPALICLPLALVILWRRRGAAGWGVWLYLSLLLGVYFVLTIMHMRIAPFVEIAFAPLMAEAVIRARQWADSIRLEQLRDLTRALVSVLLLAGFIGIGSVVAAAGSDTEEMADNWACPIDDIAAFLDDANGFGDRPRIIVSLLDHGPQLIYRTRHSVVAAPYHRNTDGILDAHGIMTATDDRESRRLMASRGAELVLLCPNGPERKLFEPSPAGRTLYSRLLTGDAPAWLRPVRLPVRLSRIFKLYEVAR